MNTEIYVKHQNKGKSKKKTSINYLKTYSFDIISNIRGILETISLEAAMSGTRQKEARSVTASCRYASRFSPLFPLEFPFPIPEWRPQLVKKFINKSQISFFTLFGSSRKTRLKTLQLCSTNTVITKAKNKNHTSCSSLYTPALHPSE